MATDQELGNIYVRLGLDTADFENGADRARKLSQNTADDIDKSFTSLSESKGGLMLFEDAIGVRLPRHLNSLIAQIPGVGAVFANMLPIIGVALAIEIVGKLIEKHEKAKEAIEETAKAWAAVDDAAAKSLYSTQTKILEVQKAVDELHHNHLAALQTELEIIDRQTFAELLNQFDQLVKGVDAAMLKLQAETGWTDAFFNFLAGVEDPTKRATKDFDEWAKSFKEGGMQADELQKKLDELYAKKDKLAHPEAVFVPEAHGATSGGGGKMETPEVDTKQLEATQGQINALLDLQRAQTTLNQLRDDQKGLATQKDFIKTGEDTSKLVQAQIDGNKKVQDAEVALWQAKQELGLAGVKKTADVEDQLTAIRLEAIKKQYSNDMIAATDHLTLLESAEVKDKVAIQKAQDEILALATQYETKLTEEQIKGANARYAAQEQALKQMQELQRKMAQERSQAEQTSIKLSMEADKELADYQYKLGTITAGERIDLLRKNAKEELDLEIKKNNDLLAEISKDDPYYPVAFQKNLDANLAAQQKFDNQIVKLDHDAMLQRKEAWDAGFQAMNRGVSTIVSDLINGNQNITADTKKMLKDMLIAWIDYFIQLEMRALETWLFMKAIGMAAGAASGGATVGSDFGTMGTDFGGYAAGGGEVVGGTTYLVGENGPELFTPGESGSITPNDKLGGGVTNVYNINASNAQSPAEVDLRIRAAIQAARPGIIRDAVAANNEQNTRH